MYVEHLPPAFNKPLTTLSDFLYRFHYFNAFQTFWQTKGRDHLCQESSVQVLSAIYSKDTFPPRTLENGTKSSLLLTGRIRSIESIFATSQTHHRGKGQVWEVRCLPGPANHSDSMAD